MAILGRGTINVKKENIPKVVEYAVKRMGGQFRVGWRDRIAGRIAGVPASQVYLELCYGDACDLETEGTVDWGEA